MNRLKPLQIKPTSRQNSLTTRSQSTACLPTIRSKLQQVHYSHDAPPLHLKQINSLDSFELQLQGAFNSKKLKYKTPLERLRGEIKHIQKETEK
ncbi:hypothetical protein SS50377_22428 [Spironucleus salmonicida]|uniref:Uncharacterized protein n=1 Tax=Spironucleus salmonicida TaxID=348837 RepID=V6LEF8_9EUKA|nr:hypothetical protein SS50377_22428 [Spironucleus salmonicida]|eukprot:EST42081.1 Hypothetical protein SS50377_18389 [Spironucleus salmonicida]